MCPYVDNVTKIAKQTSMNGVKTTQARFQQRITQWIYVA